MISIRTTRAAPDVATIERTLALLVEPGQVVELRVPKIDGKKNQTASGYFTDLHALAVAAAKFQQPRNLRAAGVYITLNPVNPALLARRENRVDDFADQATADQDVLRRRWFPVDCDPKRPAGISATAEEHAAALAKAEHIAAYLAGHGWPAPLPADSGNGGHRLYRIDLPNTPEHVHLLERCLKVLGKRFDDDRVEIDTTVFNAARIWKLYGTVAAKGDDTKDRPHRVATLLDVPPTLEPVSLEQLKALAAELDAADGAPTVTPATPATHNPLNAVLGDAPSDWTEDFIKAWPGKYGLATGAARPWNTNGWKMEFDQCPFSDAHTDGAFIGQRSKDGPIVAGCLHATCDGKGWDDLRARYDPKPPYDPKHGLTIPDPKSKAQSPGERAVAEASRPSRLIRADDLHTLPPTRYLIPGIIATNMLHQLFAPGGSGKSFIALDMALCVAQYAPVVYLAGEAIEDYKDRVEAWKLHHEKGASNLVFWNGPIKLADPMDVQAFIAEVQTVRPALIVVDPLASCMVGLEESSTGDMTIAVDSLNSIRKATAAGLLIIHHTGWAEDHERGNSTLRAACRMVMKLTNNDGLIKLSSAKQNHGAEFEPRCFRLLPTANATPVPVPARDVIQIDSKLTQKQIAVLQTLSMAQFKDGASHTQICEDTTLGKSTVNRAINTLLTRRLIQASEGRNKVYSILPDGTEELEYAASREAAPVDFGVAGGVNWQVNIDALVPEDAEQARNNSGTSRSGEARYTVPSSAVVPPLQAQVPPSSTVVPPDPELLVPCSVPSPPLRGEWMEQQPERTADDDGRRSTTIRDDIQHGRYPLARSAVRRISDPILRMTLEGEIDHAEHAVRSSDAPMVAAPAPVVIAETEKADELMIRRIKALIPTGRLDLALQRVNELASPELKAEWQQKIHEAQSQQVRTA